MKTLPYAILPPIAVLAMAVAVAIALFAGPARYDNAASSGRGAPAVPVSR